MAAFVDDMDRGWMDGEGRDRYDLPSWTLLAQALEFAPGMDGLGPSTGFAPQDAPTAWGAVSVWLRWAIAVVDQRMGWGCILYVEYC